MLRLSDDLPIIVQIIDTAERIQAFVPIVKEMVNMIIAYRNYESNAKSVQVQDQTLAHLFDTRRS